MFKEHHYFSLILSVAILACTVSPNYAAFVRAPPRVDKYDYSEVLRLSLLFYEAQRSGRLLENRIPWRGDSALDDRGHNGEDLTGGYYDAGDYVKFGFTMAFTTTILAWGMISYKEAYRDAGQDKIMLNALKWASDYFIKCHVSPNELYGQVGDFSIDHQYSGRPEDLNTSRPAYKIDEQHPGSDLAGETAAALAAVSIVFAEVDPGYAKLCRHHAAELYSFASNYRGLYHNSIKNAMAYYESTDYGDELVWAGAWLYKATRKRMYLDEAEINYDKFGLSERPAEFYYNKKTAGVQVLLAKLALKEKYFQVVREFCDYNVYHKQRTPKGLVYVDKFGTLSHTANIVFVCLEAADLGINQEQYRNFAREQINYMLGDSGRSFVVGFGENWPKRPTHSASSCPDRPLPCDMSYINNNDSNPQVLYGALVSGPNEKDFYEDDRREYLFNEVTLDFNAGFQSAIAGLRKIELDTIRLHREGITTPPSKYSNKKATEVADLNKVRNVTEKFDVDENVDFVTRKSDLNAIRNEEESDESNDFKIDVSPARERLIERIKQLGHSGKNTNENFLDVLKILLKLCFLELFKSQNSSSHEKINIFL